MLAKVKGEIEATAAKNLDTMAEDVRQEAHENINKILLSHSQGKEEKGGPGLGKQTYAKVTEATKPSFEFPTGGFMSNMRKKTVNFAARLIFRGRSTRH